MPKSGLRSNRRLNSPLKETALMLRQAQHERENACGARLSAHPEPVEGRAESLFQRAVNPLPLWLGAAGQFSVGEEVADRLRVAPEAVEQAPEVEVRVRKLRIETDGALVVCDGAVELALIFEG